MGSEDNNNARGKPTKRSNGRANVALSHKTEEKEEEESYKFHDGEEVRYMKIYTINTRPHRKTLKSFSHYNFLSISFYGIVVSSSYNINRHISGMMSPTMLPIKVRLL